MIAPYSGYSGLGVSTLSPGFSSAVRQVSITSPLPMPTKMLWISRKPFALGLIADGLDGRLDAERLGVAVVAVDHGLQHRLNHVRRSVEVELTGIADVEIKNLVAFAGDFVGGNGQISDGVAHVGHAAGGHHFRDSFRNHAGFPSIAELKNPLL